MEYFLDRLQREVAANIAELLATTTPVMVQLANAKFDADLAVPCFAMAKEKGQSPQVIAEKLASELTHETFDRCEAIGGFVNIWLKADALVQCLADDILKSDEAGLVFGEHAEGKGKTAIVEFPSPNMAKPFGIGHLRPANQGWAIYKLMQAMGYEVVRDSHLGDWGTPFGKWAVGYRTFSSEDRLQKDGVYELARVYIKMTAELKYEAEHHKHELADEVQQWLLKLEQSDPEATTLSKRFIQLSLDHIHKVQARLKITTDEELGESFYITDAKKMVTELIAKKIAIQQEDGSVIVPLDDYGISTPVLLQKSNGGALYATTDMATIKYRWQRWQPAKVIYIVGSEQQFHFRQIFALAHLLGYDQPEYTHISFGMITQLNDDGTRSKMSSRKGTILLEELLDKAEAHARKVIAQSDTDVAADDIAKIALGAIKFNDFAADRRTDILFDWSRMFTLQGFSGPYVQYAGVRINAILRKFGVPTDIPFDETYEWEAEKEILAHLHTYPQVVREAAAAYEPHRVAQFVYDLARILNRYYEQTSIAASEVNIQQKRLWLLGYVQQIHGHALDLLGIEVPSRM